MERCLERVCFLDESVDKEGIEKYMPEGTNYLLSTVHRFYAVKKSDKIYRSDKGNNRNNGFMPGYEIDEFQVDGRTKSGSEFSYKWVTYMSGLEDKPGKTRENILDLAAARLMFTRDFEENSFKLHQNFMDCYKGDCRRTFILQSLSLGGEKQKNEFLKNIRSKKLKNFCEKVIVIEDRSSILFPKDVEKLERKYYTEVLIPISTISNSDERFGRNIIDFLTYHLKTYKKIHEKNNDFLYKGRAEDWRNEHWSFFEWSLLFFARVLLSGQSSLYIETITKSKLGKDLDLFYF